MAGNKLTHGEIEFIFEDMKARLKMPYATLQSTNGAQMKDCPNALGVCRGNCTEFSIIQLNVPLMVQSFKEHRQKYYFEEFMCYAEDLTTMVEFVLIHELTHAMKNKELYDLFSYFPDMQAKLDREKPDQLPDGSHTTQFNIRAMALMGRWKAVK